jgi:sugar phosphate permease
MADAIAKRYGWYDLYPNEAVDELYKKYDDYELPNCEEEYPKNFPTIIYIVHLNYCFYYFTKVLKFLKNQLVSNGGQYQQTM